MARHEVLDAPPQAIHFRQQLALGVLVLGLAQLLGERASSRRDAASCLAQLLHGVEARAIRSKSSR